MSRIDIESEEFEEFKLIIKAKCLNEGKSMEETEYILNEFLVVKIDCGESGN